MEGGGQLGEGGEWRGLEEAAIGLGMGGKLGEGGGQLGEGGEWRGLEEAAIGL